MAYNDETCCRCPSKLDKSITGAVGHKALLDYIRTIKEDDIEIVERKGKLAVSGKSGSVDFNKDAEIKLLIDQVEVPDEWKPLNEDFCEAVKIVEQCAGTDRKNVFAHYT